MKTRKGIILAGGHGTRLYPLTLAVSKQLLPVYDKPMIYYPLCVLMNTHIREILVITTRHDLCLFQRLLQDGSHLGLSISYLVQDSPDGLPQAFLLGESFLEDHPSCLILGDNIFYGSEFDHAILRSISQGEGATLFASPVRHPERYGNLTFNPDGSLQEITEKPLNPKSNFAVTGLYLFDEKAPLYASTLKPSRRGELEITDLLSIYLKNQSLRYEKLSHGTVWLDMGTHDSLMEAAAYVEAVEKRQGVKICCPEEIAFRKKWITKGDFLELQMKHQHSSYGHDLERILKITEDS